MREVVVCPKCKRLFVHRKKGGCPDCGQLIARDDEFWGEDEIWMGRDNKGEPYSMTYAEGLKRAEN